MGNLRISEWRKLPVSLKELCIDITLRCGQSFRWKKFGDSEWCCTLHNRIISLRQDPDYLHFRTIHEERSISPKHALETKLSEDEDTESLLRHYFNLDTNLTALYEQWSSADANFKKRAPRFTGVRILRQDAWEALIGFICSSNNNIARISQMVNNLCLHYGPLIGHFHGQEFHGFPSPEALTVPGVESHLRQLGFGYRAKYIAQTALIVAKERETGWLKSLCNSARDSHKLDENPLPAGGREGYRKAHEELLLLQGVGPKVADCVCLMGLGWGEAVPVDTHVWQIAQRDYKFGKGKHKSLTKATYDAVGDHFRKLWGEEAGWAHSVLFTADLKTFSDRLDVKVEVDIAEALIKQEDDTIVKVENISKRKYVIEDSKEGLEDKKTVLLETTKNRRVKRRKNA
ncbi:DNA glycosylase [Xylogone sp. PMI_703]|nr:DNA glycosylase [Xylogone sp. PMI_703]